MDEYILKCEKLTKVIGKKTIVKDISFNIKEGEILGFIGPNGSGKSTTIKMILGLISITSGNAYICGKDIEKNFEKAILHVGAVVENPDMYMYLTGYDNLKQYARIYKIKEDRIREVVEIVGLKERINDKISKYSLGMKQRLGIAQALLHNPKLLILDEPTNGLDPTGMRELRELLTNLAKEKNIGIFVSSHILSEIESFCTNICMIKNGRMIETTTIKDLKENMLDYNSKITYFIETDNNEKACEILKNCIFSDTVEISESSIKVNIDTSNINDVILSLINSNIKIYDFRKDIKTLEDVFIEKTGGNIID